MSVSLRYTRKGPQHVGNALEPEKAILLPTARLLTKPHSQRVIQLKILGTYDAYAQDESA